VLRKQSLASPESASPIGVLTQPKSIRQVAMDFIRWRRAKGYEVAPFKRQFWDKKAWHNSQEAKRLKLLVRRIFGR